MSLGSVGGVKFRINIWFLLLGPIYFALGSGEAILVIVTAVIIHELAHLLCAAALGVKVAEVELMPFGGQARMQDFTGMEPGKEILVAAAGPGASLSLAGFFYFLAPWSTGSSQEIFIQINLVLGLFNLLPALPLDGGRVLRAVWSKSSGYKKATARSAFLGQLMGAVLAGGGIYLTIKYIYGANFIILGIFIFWAARRESKFLAYSFMRFLINKKAQLMQEGLVAAMQFVARPDALVKDVLQNSKPNYYMLLVVIDEQHQIRQMLTEAELIEALFNLGPTVHLRDI